MEIGDRVVQLINQFTPEQVEALKKQVGKRRKSDNSGYYKTEADHGTITNVFDDSYLVAFEIEGRTRMRKVQTRKLCLESEYDPATLILVP